MSTVVDNCQKQQIKKFKTRKRVYTAVFGCISQYIKDITNYYDKIKNLDSNAKNYKEVFNTIDKSLRNIASTGLELLLYSVKQSKMYFEKHDDCKDIDASKEKYLSVVKTFLDNNPQKELSAMYDFLIKCDLENAKLLGISDNFKKEIETDLNISNRKDKKRSEIFIIPYLENVGAFCARLLTCISHDIQFLAELAYDNNF